MSCIKNLLRPERVTAFVLVLALLLTAVPGVRADALNSYADHYVRVGLAYGTGGKSAATLQVASGTGTGFQAGYVNPSTDVFKSYYTFSCMKVTVVRSLNYNISSASYVADGSDQSSCVGRWHIELQTSYSSQSELDSAVSAAASATGYVCYPSYTSNGYRVRIGRFTSETSANEVSETILSRLSASSEFPSASVKTVSGGSNGYVVLEYGTRNILFEWDGSTQELALKATGGTAPETYFATSSGTYRYYGLMDFVQSSSQVFSVINVVPLGLYIRGVVPYELNTGWPIESLKAMAVIAATFAVYNEGRHSSSGCDLCTGQHCQVYRGIGTSSYRYETAKVISCCDAIEGMIITYDGDPIQAVYHSTNGGFTEDSENVWVAVLPYLRSVKELYEQNTIGATAAQNGVWVNELTASEITAKLTSKGYSIGTVKSVEVTARTSAGSALTLSISDGTTTINLSKENMRMVLGTDVLLSQNFKVYPSGSPSVYVNNGVELSNGLNGVYVINGSGSIIALPSTARTVLTGSGQEVISDSSSSSSQEASWVFDGAGWGHSLGLCQWGSYGMAEAGFTFDQIIKYYYTGVRISGFDY